MDQAMTQVVIAGVIELLALPILIFVVKHVIGKRLDAFDEKREEARIARAETEQKIIEQREAERSIVLAIARTMLLNNYEKCLSKGYYSVEERDVYSKLYESYKLDHGNGVIDAIAKRIRELPTEPPRDKEA
jgi:hypothetical protein